jgi:ABC-type uncharacterized transport system permease subunit
MHSALTFSLLGFVALLPAAVYGATRKAPAGGTLFWALGLVALVGLGGALAGAMGANWTSGFTLSLWASTLVTLICFLAFSLFARPLPRLAGLLFPYLAVLGALIVAFSGVGKASAMHGGAPALWITLHIAMSLVTYSLVTIAALLGVSVLLRERAMKRKRDSEWLQSLPAVADAERLELAFLGAAEFILGLGIISGMALLFAERGTLIMFDHKTVFSFLAFIAIAVLLIMRLRSGLRGRAVSRVVLTAFLLLTLGFLGVKFVSDVILG